MNKDVIYIEPEDDITDIITKIQSAKERIVALVPPKKAGVFRSIVNIKLIAKTSTSAGKTVVLVTTDPSIIKLAAATRLSVTKNLQTPPRIPEAEDLDDDEVASEDLIEEEKEEAEADEATAEASAEAEAREAEEEAEDLAEEEKRAEKAEKAKKDKKDVKDTDKSKKPLGGIKERIVDWVKGHKKASIGIGVGFVALIIFIVWGFIIAPAATITVQIRTNAKNLFSENVTFTTKAEEEDAENGKFYIQEKKIETKIEKDFEATGEKNLGEKATGTIIIYDYFRDPSTIAVNAGSKFEINGLAFTADHDASLSWSGTDGECQNQGKIGLQGCLISKNVSVTAVESGTKYNVGAANGWSTAAGVSAYSDKAMSGGTDKNIIVVQQSDIDKAKNEILQKDQETNKEKLISKVENEKAFPITSSFKEEAGDATSTPAVGEEVEGGKAKISVTVVDTIFVIDEAKVQEFITKKAKIADKNKVYSVNDLFIENFSETDKGYTGRLKASYITGPSVSENDIIDIVKGKGFGSAQHDLKDIDGIGSVTINGSLPWVTSFPNNPEKITVIIDVKGDSENKNENS